MPVSFERDGRLFVVRAVGQYPAAGMKSALDEIMALPDFPGDALLLVDMSRADSVLQHSIGELKDVARHFSVHAVSFQSQTALLVSGLARYGLMRMASVWVEPEGVSARVFRDEQAARDWLLATPMASASDGN